MRIASSLPSKHDSGNTRQISQNSDAGRMARAATIANRGGDESIRSSVGADRARDRRRAPWWASASSAGDPRAACACARACAPGGSLPPFRGPSFGGLFVVAAELHLAENALALHLLLQRLEGLVDIVVANENLHALFL